MGDIGGIVNATTILYLLLPAGFGLTGVAALAVLLYDRWQMWRRDRRRLMPEAPAGYAGRQWQQRPDLLPISHVLSIGGVGAGVTAYVTYRGILVLAVLAAVGTGIVLWFWRSQLYDRWARELDRQTFLLARHLRNRLEQGVTLLVALEQIHRQQYTLSPTLRDEVRLLLRHVTAGETLAGTLLAAAGSVRYGETQIYRRLLFHLGRATEEYMGPDRIAELLDTFLEVATLVRDTQRTLDARIAQAKYSRWIVTGLLPVVVLLVARLAPEFGAHLLHHPIGNVALGVAALLAGLAYAISRRLAKLKPLSF